ncbi:MAG: hypothetical protein AAB345_01360 [Patescibacteria group bacterium]
MTPEKMKEEMKFARNLAQICLGLSTVFSFIFISSLTEDFVIGLFGMAIVGGIFLGIVAAIRCSSLAVQRDIAELKKEMEKYSGRSSG